MQSLIDPNELMQLPRAVRAVRWRLPLEFTQWFARLTYHSFNQYVDPKTTRFVLRERGAEIPDTSVTLGQRAVLLAALQQTEEMNLPIAEVGAWRAATTVALAAATRRQIFAVDPFNNYPGAQSDLAILRERIRRFNNVEHIRLRSGQAARALADVQFSLIFIDAIHDYINTWFDFLVWQRLLAPAGLIAFHDVDDHPGTNLACRRVARQKTFQIWGYCPNLVVFQKLSSLP